MNNIKNVGFMAFVISWLFYAQSTVAQTFVAGKDYLVVDNAIVTQDPNKIEVREFFWYGCPHCYQLDSYLETWLEKLPSDVDFIRTPAVMAKNWRAHAQAFYVAKLLGQIETIHLPLMQALHRDKKDVFSRSALQQFFAQYGIDPEQLDGVYDSHTVRREMLRARRLASQLKISAVPAMVINGKYFTDAKLANGFDRMLQVIDYLVNKERDVR